MGTRFAGRTLVSMLAATVACGLCVVPAAATAPAATPTAGECATTLACSAADIGRLPMTARLEFVRAMESGPAQGILPGFDRWRNIEGVLEFFAARDWGKPGTWASIVDSAILAGAEHGLALALGRTDRSFANPGAAKWASYLERLRDGELADRATHDQAWGDAEQASTDWGTELSRRAGSGPSAVQFRWFQFTQLYRAALRNRPFALDLIARYGPLIDPSVARFKVPFYDWATDVRTDVPAREGAQAFYDFARFDVLPAGVDAAAVFLAYLPVAYREFRAETA